MNDGDNVSVAAQLEKLQALRSSGSLSEAEFQKLKAALVAQASVAPKGSGGLSWAIGALAAMAVVVALILFAMPRHGSSTASQQAAQLAGQSAAPQPAAQPPAAPEPAASALDRAANDAGAPPAAGAAPVPPPTFPTSFDCSQARRLALRLICINPNLASQDMQLAALYRRARANAIDPSQLSDQQQQWLAARDSCGSIGCLSAVYAARRRELAQWITN
ncbi:MAG TPA: hypothetical protein VH189_02305 [Rhizomicrobium sp.]|jgi:uncharacterized protein YecT (DUF1311 family)|nr:hypothetical protein [Rhizomicrobium sp.]